MNLGETQLFHIILQSKLTETKLKLWKSQTLVLGRDQKSCRYFVLRCRKKVLGRTYQIVGCAVLSGVPECERVGPKQGSPLYKSALSRGFGFLSQQWNTLERGGCALHSAGSDRSGRPYLAALLLQGNKKGENQEHSINLQ